MTVFRHSETLTGHNRSTITWDGSYFQTLSQGRLRWTIVSVDCFHSLTFPGQGRNRWTTTWDDCFQTLRHPGQERNCRTIAWDDCFQTLRHLGQERNRWTIAWGGCFRILRLPDQGITVLKKRLEWRFPDTQAILRDAMDETLLGMTVLV